MPVVESPFWDSWPGREGALPPKGVFVLLKIDPVASVANLDDEEATRAAAALDRHEWALGVVTGTGGGSFIDPMAKAVLSLQIQLIGQGPPDDKPIASIPISPSPQLYDDRSPLELNAPLPWSDLYVHTKYSSSVIISRIHYGATKFETELTNAEREDLFKRAHVDRYNWRNLPPVTPADPVDDVVAPTEPSDSSEQTGDSDDESSSDEESLYAQEMEDLGTKLLRQRIYGEISLDPSMCPGSLGVPCQLTEPVRRIRELWSAWEERRTTQILAKRPQTTAWAQGVTDAQSFNDPGFEPDNVRPPETPLDDEIMPEDAIDDRIERDRLARAAKRAAPPSPQTGVDVPMPNVIPSPPLSSTVAPVPGSATSQIEVALSDRTSVDDDKDAPGALVSRAPERATNVGDAESQTVPPRALEAEGPAYERRGEGSPAAETPSCAWRSSTPRSMKAH